MGDDARKGLLAHFQVAEKISSLCRAEAGNGNGKKAIACQWGEFRLLIEPGDKRSATEKEQIGARADKQAESSCRMFLTFTNAARNPLSCNEFPIRVKIVSIPTIPYSSGERMRPKIIPNKSTSTCWAPLLMAPQKSPLAVFSFSEGSGIELNLFTTEDTEAHRVFKLFPL